MVNNNKACRLGIRAALSSALFLVATSASAVVVDGNLADLLTAISNEPYAPQNTVTATDPNNDGESNGFDITNGYAWYNGGNDTFYFGMRFFGQVGTAGGNEGVAFSSFCPGTAPGYAGVAGVFDACERYGFSIDIDANGSNEFDFMLRGDGLADGGTEVVFSIADNTGLGLGVGAVNWAVSEFYDEVEFSITGLRPLLEPFSPANPRNVDITLRAGSITNIGPEDTLVLGMQVVPVPAAVWLFGSGLVGLLGFSAKRSRKQLR